ncbi:MAG: DUF5011 domain-containing protein [Bacteroidales bacterium]|nr:DUF5011 domain-containing protein [Bacteroidales bacterium]
MKHIKKIIMVLFVGCLTLGLISCKKETENLASITEWPEFELTGGSFVNLAVSAESFVDPGVSARYTSTGAAATVTTTGSVNMQVPGLYQLLYSAKDLSQQWTIDVPRNILVTNDLLTENYAGNYTVKTVNGFQTGTTPFATKVENLRAMLAAGSTTDRGTRAVTQMIPGQLGWYMFSDINWQASPMRMQFFDFGGGTFQPTPTSSNFGSIEGLIEYDPATQTFTIFGIIPEGVNAGLTWCAVYTKI